MILGVGGAGVLATKAEINQLLADMRLAITQKKCILVPRKVNMDTLARLGMMPCDAYQEIFSLTIAEYYSGPISDRDYPQKDKLWIFKKNILEHTIYIKIKIEYQINGEVKIISFHIDNA